MKYFNNITFENKYIKLYLFLNRVIRSYSKSQNFKTKLKTFNESASSFASTKFDYTKITLAIAVSIAFKFTNKKDIKWKDFKIQKFKKEKIKVETKPNRGTWNRQRGWHWRHWLQERFISAHILPILSRSIEINQNKHTDRAIGHSYRKLQRRLQLSHNELRFAKRRNRCIKNHMKRIQALSNRLNF